MKTKIIDTLKYKQIDSVIFDLNDVYSKYKCIYFKISNKSQSDTYAFEINLLREVDMLINTIRSSTLQYYSLNLTPETIINSYNTLIEKIVKNLLIIKEFCSCLTEYVEISKDGEVVSKDIITKRAENDLYIYLLEIIESLNPMQNLNELYLYLSSSATLPENKSKKIINAINESENSEIKSTIDLRIRANILKIINMHYSEYFKECYIFESRLSKIIESIDNSKYAKEWYDKNTTTIKKIHCAIRNDDFKQVESLIIEIENTLPL